MTSKSYCRKTSWNLEVTRLDVWIIHKSKAFTWNIITMLKTKTMIGENREKSQALYYTYHPDFLSLYDTNRSWDWTYPVRWFSISNTTLLYSPTLSFYSQSSKTSYRKISWSPEAARLSVIIIVSLWNLTGISAALLPMCLSNFRTIGKV